MMLNYFISIYLSVNLLFRFPIAASSGCESPKVSHSSYTPTDAQALTHIPFIALPCSPCLLSCLFLLCKQKQEDREEGEIYLGLFMI